MYNQQVGYNIVDKISGGLSSMILPTIVQCHGNAEEWREFPYHLFPDVKKHYMVSNYGRVYNMATNTYLPKNIYYDKDKYITISLSADNDSGHIFFQIHRLVMITFSYISDFEKYDVNHNDGVKFHNWIWNLEWCTKSENIQHALNNNLFKLGSDRLNSKVDETIVNDICYLLQEGYTNNDIKNEIINKFGIDTSSIIPNIKAGLSWTYISKKYDFGKISKKNNFTDNEIHKICNIFSIHGRDLSYKEILDMIGFDYSNCSKKELAKLNSCICAIRQKNTFKNICSQYNY